MTWLKIDDKFAEHAKVENLSDKAFRFHVAALCRCASLLTDGRVSDRDVRILTVVVKANTWKKYVNELVAAGLWTPQAHGWSINDYLDYNPSSVKVKEMRARKAELERQRREQARGEPRGQARGSAPSPTRVYKEEPTTLVPSDVTSEIDPENVIRLQAILKDVS